MVSILLSHWMRERRNPFLLLLFIGISIIATLMFGGGMTQKMKIDVFRETGELKESEKEWLLLLNKGDTFKFRAQDEQSARTKVREGRADLAVKLTGDDYRIIAVKESPNAQLAEQHIRTVFERELELRAVSAAAGDEKGFRSRIDTYLEEPPLTLQVKGTDGEELLRYDMGLQLMFGFSLFLVMLTIGFKVNTITKDKITGIWSRLILSPVRKSEIYFGHLLYSTMIGIVQITVVFLIFRYAFNFGLGHRYGLLLLVIALYSMTIVAMCILLAGILRTPEKFNMLFPSIVPIMPLVSGVYMPPGTITSPILLGVAEIFPITHAMEALTGIAIYDNGIGELWLPLSKLILIAVLCMGIGINLMERRHV